MKFGCWMRSACTPYPMGMLAMVDIHGNVDIHRNKDIWKCDHTVDNINTVDFYNISPSSGPYEL